MRSLSFLLAVFSVASPAQTPQDDKRLLFSTFLGGTRADEAQAVAVDAQGHTYVTGTSHSGDFPGKAFMGVSLAYAVPRSFLTKYSADGKEILWSHIIGGSSNTFGSGITIDREGNVYIIGRTGSVDFPVLKPVQDKKTGLNIAYLMKFDPAGKLLFSTFLGGERNDDGNAVAVDSTGNMYIAGRTSSTEFPVKNAMQPKMAGGGQDAFVAKISANYQLEWATYLGGTSGTDNIFAIAVGPDDSLFVTGETTSPGLATEGAWLKEPPPYSSFVAKLSPAGTTQYFTYVGHRSGYSKTTSIVVDPLGRAWVGGYTNAKDMPTTENAFQPKYAGGHRDGFILRLNAEASKAEYLTYLGGSLRGDRDPDDTVESLSVDAHGHVYVTGETFSTDFPTHRPVQPYAGGVVESYMLRLDTGNKQIIFSTFWGGGKRDAGTAVALGPGENATFIGITASDNLPLQLPVSKQFGPSTDGFVSRVCDPWLGATAGSLAYGFTLGSSTAPDAQSFDIYTGCTTPHDFAEITSDQPWLNVRYEGRTAPLKITAEVKTADLPAGEYKATIKIHVPAAFNSTLLIPVALNVYDPPAE